MTTLSTFRRRAWFALFVALAAGAVTANAQSISVGQCFKGSEIDTTLRSLLVKDGQNYIAQATENDGADTARRYYANADGSLGYDLKGNLPGNQKQTEYCVTDMNTNITPLSRKLSAPPAWLKIRSGDGSTGGGSNIDHSYRIGSKFALAVQTLVVRDGKVYRSNMAGIITNNNGAGFYMEIDSSGKAVGRYMVENFKLTQHGEELFSRLNR